MPRWVAVQGMRAREKRGGPRDMDIEVCMWWKCFLVEMELDTTLSQTHMRT